MRLPQCCVKVETHLDLHEWTTYFHYSSESEAHERCVVGRWPFSGLVVHGRVCYAPWRWPCRTFGANRVCHAHFLRLLAFVPTGSISGNRSCWSTEPLWIVLKHWGKGWADCTLFHYGELSPTLQKVQTTWEVVSFGFPHSDVGATPTLSNFGV